MTLKIISAENIVYEGSVTAVTLPGSKGAFTVLNNHASLISTLSAGKISYVAEDGKTDQINVPGGVADVDNNIISVCIY